MNRIRSRIYIAFKSVIVTASICGIHFLLINICCWVNHLTHPLSDEQFRPDLSSHFKFLLEFCPISKREYFLRRFAYAIFI